MDLIKNEILWFGDENDIQIGDGGIKLSWNGTFIPKEYKNPLPNILKRLVDRESNKELLPFPKSKSLDEIL